MLLNIKEEQRGREREREIDRKWRIKKLKLEMGVICTLMATSLQFRPPCPGQSPSYSGVLCSNFPSEETRHTNTPELLIAKVL